jgi:cyclin-dependent kinase 12/13
MPPSVSFLQLRLLLGRRRRRRGNSSGGMGCAQGKSSRGSPARSDGRGVDRLKRDNDYRPGSSVSRLSDPLPATAESVPAPAAPPTKEHARRAAAVVPGGKTPDDGNGDAAAQQATTAATPPTPPLLPPRREDELVDGWPTWLLDNVPREALQGIVPKSADAYDKIEKVGQGTYSNVYKARERGTGRIVALKKVRFDTSESESVRFMAREIRFLQRLDHPNVMKLEGIATSRMHRSIYLVFDFMYSDLGRLVLRSQQRLTEPQVSSSFRSFHSQTKHHHLPGHGGRPRQQNSLITHLGYAAYFFLVVVLLRYLWPFAFSPFGPIQQSDRPAMLGTLCQ